VAAFDFAEWNGRWLTGNALKPSKTFPYFPAVV